MGTNLVYKSLYQQFTHLFPVMTEKSGSKTTTCYRNLKIENPLISVQFLFSKLQNNQNVFEFHRKPEMYCNNSAVLCIETKCKVL